MASLRRAMLLSQQEASRDSPADDAEQEKREEAKKRPRPANLPFASGKLAAMAKRQKKSPAPRKKKAAKKPAKKASPKQKPKRPAYVNGKLAAMHRRMAKEEAEKRKKEKRKSRRKAREVESSSEEEEEEDESSDEQVDEEDEYGDDDDEDDLGYGSDLIIDEDDRQKLLNLPEAKREEIFLQRHEAREEWKENRKNRMALREAKMKEREMARKPKKKKKKRRLKRKKVIVESEDDDSDYSARDSGDDKDEDEDYVEERDDVPRNRTPVPPPPPPSAPTPPVIEKPAIPQNACSKSMLQKVTLTRHRLIAMLGEPYFEHIRGLYVRYSTKRGYRVLKIVGVVKGKTYDALPNQLSTDWWLTLKSANPSQPTGNCMIGRVSNQNITDAEFERWQGRLAAINSVPSEEDLQMLYKSAKKKIHEHQYEFSDVKRMVQKNKAKRKTAVNPTKEKMESERKLIAAKQRLDAAGDDEYAKAEAQREVNELTLSISRLDAQLRARASKADKSAVSINKRNYLQNLQRMKDYDAARAKEKASNTPENPWARAPTRPVQMWQTKRKTPKPAAAPAADAGAAEGKSPAAAEAESAKEKKKLSVNLSPQKAKKLLRHTSSVEVLGKSISEDDLSPRSKSALQRTESNLYKAVSLSVLGDKGGSISSSAETERRAKHSASPSQGPSGGKTLSLAEYMAKRKNRSRGHRRY